MKTVITGILLAVFFTGCGDESAEKEVVKTENYQNAVWQKKYRSGTTVDQTLRYTDAKGFTTVADSSFVVEIFNAVSEGKVKILDPNFMPVSADSAKYFLMDIRSYVKYNEDGTSEEVADTLRYMPDEVIEIFTQEEWILEAGTYQLSKKVYAYGPVVASFDHEGNIRGKKLLFLISNTD